MYKTVLVKELIEEGEKLVQALEAKRVAFEAAFWYHEPTRTSWRLYIATKAVERRGPTDIYKRIYAALQQTRPELLSLDDISLLSPTSIKFRDLQSELGGLRRLVRRSGMRVPNGAVFEDPYIYRWRPNGRRTS